MARRPNVENIYRAASLFRTNCLSGNGSLLWPKAKPWTIENVEALWNAVMEHPDVSGRSFFEKLQDQIAPESDDVARIAADILAVYYLYPNKTNSSKKLANLRDVADWKGLGAAADFSSVESAYAESGIGHPGVYYSTGIPNLFGFLIGFGLEALRQPDFLADSSGLERLCDAAATRVKLSTTIMRNVLLHLLDPEHYERVAVDYQKERILRAFANLDPQVGSVDSRLLGVREQLSVELGRTDFDFYDPDLEVRWQPAAKPRQPTPLAPRQVWIEKTNVDGNPSRKIGEHALGRALWSPQKSKGSADIYRFMRDVRPGDLVLHLTDSNGFTGISAAASVADDTFVGLPGTAWAELPCYRIQLADFTKLEPPLGRDVFFSGQFASRLVELARSGARNLFYNAEPSLNQGAYLTPAPPELLAILNDAYQSVAHRDLVPRIAGDSTEDAPLTVPQAEPVSLDVVCKAFADALHECGVSFGRRHLQLTRSFVVSLATKRFVILTGLSGSGKTQLGLRFGEWLGGDRNLVVPVRPDWTSGDALFGFEDALQPAIDGRKAWQVPEVLRFMLRAADDTAHPYVLLLDEMNLAHVERYFADVLSGMESGQPCLPNLECDADGHWRVARGSPDRIPIPPNLFVVGTVNVDETTYMFSPKVLDRANTFEFRVGTEDLVSSARRPTRCRTGDDGLVAGFASVSGDANWHVNNPADGEEAFKEYLQAVHSLLVPLGFEFGHRTYVEAIRFASLLSAAGDVDPLSALDFQIMQKILPRLHGSRRRLEPVLAQIGAFCHDPTAVRSNGTDRDLETFDAAAVPAQPPTLAMSFDKVRRMTILLRANQFVSFTE